MVYQFYTIIIIFQINFSLYNNKNNNNSQAKSSHFINFDINLEIFFININLSIEISLINDKLAYILNLYTK